MLVCFFDLAMIRGSVIGRVSERRYRHELANARPLSMCCMSPATGDVSVRALTAIYVKASTTEQVVVQQHGAFCLIRQRLFAIYVQMVA